MATRRINFGPEYTGERRVDYFLTVHEFLVMEKYPQLKMENGYMETQRDGCKIRVDLINGFVTLSSHSGHARHVAKKMREKFKVSGLEFK